MGKNLGLVSIALLILLASAASADVYVRDYTHTAGDADSKISSRTIALDQVKKLLLEEIGVHVRARFEVKQSQYGLEFAQEEIETLAAGIVSVNILEEKWDGLTFYLKAQMEADPDEVLTAIEQFKQRDSSLVAQLELERAALRQARLELSKYQQGFTADNDETLVAQEANYNKNVTVIEAYDYVEQGIQFSRTGRYVEAAELLIKAHELGNERATIALANIYNGGTGVRKNRAKADDLFKQAKDSIFEKAQAGEAFYQNALGLMYWSGLGGVDRNPHAAETWFKKSISNALLPASVNLITLYAQQKQYGKALKLCQELIDVDHPQGYSKLALLYYNGLGVDKDYNKAFILAQKAVARGSNEDLVLIAHYYQQGIGNVEADHRKALEALKKAASLGVPKAYSSLGSMYYAGRGVERDFGKAEDFFLKAAEHGDSYSYVSLGFMYLGNGVEQDLKKARYWLEKAETAGREDSKAYLSKLEKLE